MIQFKISKSSDPNVLNTYQFMQNLIYLGRSSGNLRIADPLINPTHLMIEVVEKDLIVHPQRDVSHYLINGKRATQVRKIKLGDTLTVGNTTLEILGFEETQVQEKKQILDKKMATLLEQNSGRLDIIEQLVRLSK